MTVPSAGLVVVGAGECGARAALALREQGWTGPVTLVGAEDAAPYERPPLSKAAMTSIEMLPPTTICDGDTLHAAGIAFIPGVPATAIDREAHRVVLGDGRTIAYQRMLLATGSQARRLPLHDGDGVLYLRSHADALVLRAHLRTGTRLAVIGGGFIGLEVAASAWARGCAVTVLEMAPRLMARGVPADIAAVIEARHRSAGVELHCGVGLVGLERRQDGWYIELASGELIVADTVVAGIGAVPETALAHDAGLAVENGIRVDSRLATSDPDIFAAGDCCSFPHPLFGNRRIRLEAWRNAQDQGTAAARNMLGADEAFAAVPWFWSDQYDLTLQIAGLPDAGESEIVRRRPDGVDVRFGLGSDGRLLVAAAVGEGNAVARDIRIAEMLIARRATPDPEMLADPTVTLKALLKVASARLDHGQIGDAGGTEPADAHGFGGGHPARSSRDRR